MTIGDRIKSEVIKRAINWFVGWLKSLFSKEATQAAEHIPDPERYTSGIPDKPKVRVHRTAKRGPPEPPPSLSGT